MTSIAKLKLLVGAGDPDSALSIRIDIVQSAMKVLEASDKVRKLSDYAAAAMVDAAVWDLLVRCRRYRRAVRSRAA